MHDVSGCTEKYYYKDDWETVGWWFERSDCGLTEIPEDIPEDSTFVDLGSNSLVSLDNDTFPSLPNCVRLFLEKNMISEIEAGAFSDITNLESLSLDENKMAAIRGHMWEGLTKLTGLYLDSNEIGRLSRASFSIRSQDEDVSSPLTSCKTLILANNLISEIEAGTFSDLVHLEYLKLKGNKLTEVRADMWLGLVNLKDLLIDDNEIDHLPDGAFSSMTKLTSLDVSGNRLTEATGEMFRGLDLWSLNIGGNRISSIQGLQRAFYVYFTNNQLTTLEEDAFLPDDEDSPRINLHFPRNPFHCDQRMCWLKKAEKSKRVFFYYWSYATSSPSCENFPGVDWREVDLGCDEE